MLKVTKRRHTRNLLGDGFLPLYRALRMMTLSFNDALVPDLADRALFTDINIAALVERHHSPEDRDHVEVKRPD